MTAPKDLRLCVLGGSSPGVPVLLSALEKARQRSELGQVEVRLHGRDHVRLKRICEYTESHGEAGFQIHASTQLEHALDGATHILCMVRPGGMAGRAFDEALAMRAGMPADEGIGVGGLSCFLRARPVLQSLLGQCRTSAPDALFLQMTSPLGLNVAVARRIFGEHAFGVCELPMTTARAVLSALSTRGFDPLPHSRCLGLNHQSWLYDFRDSRGRDVTADVLNAIDAEPLVGIDSHIVRDAGAIPMSYLRLYLDTQRVMQAQQRRSNVRGEELASWSQELHRAYCAGETPDAKAIDALLGQRRMNWFDEGVVPVLVASLQADVQTMPLNLPAAGAVPGVPPDAIVEADCEVSCRGIRIIPAPALPPQPDRLMRRLLDFERAALSLADVPSETAIAEVLELHPLAQGCALSQIAHELRGAAEMARSLEPGT